MFVSVLMPVHGGAPFLKEAISSVQSQDFGSWELLLVLDRPSNELTALANIFVKDESRIKVLVSPGSGIVDALNFGISIASGGLIARIDSDDVMEPNRLSKQVELLMQSPRIAVIGTQMTFIDSNGLVIGKTSYPITPSDIRKHLRYQNCIGHPSIMYRKKNVVEVGGYRKALTGVEDYDLWLRLSKSFEIQNLDQALTRYRISPSQYSKTFGSKYTILEEAARLDAIVNFIDDIPQNDQSIDLLQSKISRTRRRNIYRKPLKIIYNYQGYFVSRIIRIISSKEVKLLKVIKCIPFAVCLVFIAPNSIRGLIRQKMKGRNS
jgi:glycosyltransferase involved in cell wall biosynthesis